MSVFVHQELQTSDAEAAKAFYSKVFGWQMMDMPMPEGTYTMVSGPAGPIGGIVKAMPGVPTGWIGYVGVDSVDKTSDAVTAAGGKVTMDKQEVPGPDGKPMGWLAWFTDPQGVTFAVWQDGAPRAASKKKATKKKAAKKKAAKKKAATKKPATKKPAKKKATKKKAAKKEKKGKKGKKGKK